MPVSCSDPLDRESPPCEPLPKSALDSLEGQLKLDDRGRLLAIAQQASTAEVLGLCWLDLPLLRQQLEDGDFVGFGLHDSGPASFGRGVKTLDVRLDCDGDCLILKLDFPSVGQNEAGAGREDRERASIYRPGASIRHLSGQLRFDRHGLVPAIAQDAENGEVLMQAWMSRESLERQSGTDSVCYWSRSRRQLWVKGEQSGNRQQLLELRVADDNASLLLQVRQHGHACHKNRRSCFFRRLGRQGLEECSGRSKPLRSGDVGA